MDSPLSQWFFFGAAILAAVGIYAKLLKRISADGGKVRTAEFDIPDLLVSFVLISVLMALCVSVALAPPQPEPAIDINQVLTGSLPLLIVAAGLGGFLALRKVNLFRLLGLDRISALQAAMVGGGLVVAAYPLIWGAATVSHALWQDTAPEQGLVTLFREVSRNNDLLAMGKIFVAAVVFAPLAEEFVFRGYFYGTLKRYCGPVLAALLTAALFSAIHLNLSSAPSLFVLALCFTLAYEATGSLVVPVTMHMLFNLSQLASLVFVTRSQPL